MASDSNENHLLGSLSRLVASGGLSEDAVWPVIRELSGSTDESLLRGQELIRVLREHPSPAVNALIEHIQERRRTDAYRLHRLLNSGSVVPEEIAVNLGDLPALEAGEWPPLDETLDRIRAALGIARDRAFISTRRARAPRIAEAIDAAFEKEVSWLEESIEARGLLPAGALLERMGRSLEESGEEAGELLESLRSLRAELESTAPGLSDSPLESRDEIEKLSAIQGELEILEELRRRLKNETTPTGRDDLVDRLGTWPTGRVARTLLEGLEDEDSRERACLILRVRFGGGPGSDWATWRNWLEGIARYEQEKLEEFEARTRDRIEELLMLRLGHEDAGAELLELLEARVAGRIGELAPAKLDAFVERWAGRVPGGEWKELTGCPVEVSGPELPPAPAEEELEPTEPTTPAEKAPASGPAPPGEPVERERETPTESPVPAAPAAPRPAAWREHLQPFFLENWYMVAGILMVIIGASLLAFYTWDKHWLVRYTVVPMLLAAFTATLAGLGRWMERRDESFLNTAAVLRGAAIGLLPVNFMTVALLSNDDEVGSKLLVVPLMGALYLGLAGWGLHRWCGGVHPALGGLLGRSLLTLNSLVIIGPLATALFPSTGVGGRIDESVLLTVGVGFHLGFAVLAFTVIRFLRGVLTPELAEDRRVPWFVGVTLVLTFLQVFAWVHGFMQHVPRVWTYAPMVVAAGWLVLFVERRVLLLQARERGEVDVEAHGTESFIGFAAILLGILMGMTEEITRILVFSLAAAAWIHQARFRQQAVHHWIGLTFLSLAGASVGLIEGFPPPGLAAIGLALYFLLEALRRLPGSIPGSEFDRSCRGMQGALLVVTTVAATLAQWYFQLDPVLTAGYLLVVVALLLWGAFRDDRLRWVHTAMVVLALTLPYLGFVDVSGSTLRGNTMVFGLACLSSIWLVITATLRQPLLLRARSTVLVFYGFLAVAAMVMRVILERGQPFDPEWYLGFMDYAGPVLMLVVLTFTTYHSRSWIPAGLAIFIAVILFPELKSHFRETFEMLGHGSGLGSACSALALILICFPLRKARWLRDLPDGDVFLGRGPFPIRRQDHTLFTAPLLAATLFLSIKVDTWNAIRNFLFDSDHLKTCIALGVTGVVWTLVGVYARKTRFGVPFTCLGLLAVATAITTGHLVEATNPTWHRPVLWIGILFQVAYIAYTRLQRQHAWVESLLTRPTLHVLEFASPVVALVCGVALVVTREPDPLWLLTAFTGAQLLWHGVRSRRLVHGSVLFGITWIAVLVAFGRPDVSFLRSFLQDGGASAVLPTLWFLFAVQGLHLALEGTRSTHELLAPVARPFLFASTSAAGILFLLAVGFDPQLSVFTPREMIFTVVLLLLTARAQGSALLALLGVLLTYRLIHRDDLAGNRWPASLLVLVEPWRISILGLSLAVLGWIGRSLCRKNPRLLTGPFRQRFFAQDDVAWFLIPAAAIAAGATALQVSIPGFRLDSVQLWGPYLGALTLVLVGFTWRKARFAYPGAVALTIGNVGSVRIFLGDWLLERDLSGIHLVALGLVATLLQSVIVRLLLHERGSLRARTVVSRIGIVAAASTFLLLAMNYFVHPDLAGISTTRFIVSGVLALVAGYYFRHIARHPGPGETSHTTWWEALYHLGLMTAIWCGMLLIPALRHPALALYALGVPAAYFYLRVELSAAPDRSRYRNSAAVLSFVLLALYVSRGIFHMILFPDSVIETDHYHHNSPFIFVLSLLMLRLHGLGGTYWLALFGGLALALSSFFALTWLETLSPFESGSRAAWCAVAVGHFWILLSHQRSPVRTAIQRMAAIDAEVWMTLRREWGLCLLVGTQGAVLWGLLDPSTSSLQVAPLLVGASSVFFHQGALRRSSLYAALGGIEILLALHADFLVESYLPAHRVIWVFPGVWLLLHAAHQLRPREVTSRIVGIASAGLSMLTLAHVLYHRPDSPTGLWAFAIGALLASWTPRTDREPTSSQEKVGALLLIVPLWLAYFGCAPLRERGLEGAWDSWALLVTLAMAFLIGTSGRVFQTLLRARYLELPRPRPRLFDHTLSWLGQHGVALNTWTLHLVFPGMALLHGLHLGDSPAGRELLLLAGLYLGFAVAWHHEGELRRSFIPHVLQLVSLFGLYIVLRQQIVLSRPDFWKPEYDVWVSLLISAVLSGAKPFFDRKPRELRLPLTGLLFVLPALAMGWVLFHQLGSNTALLVVGLHSLLFAYTGKDDRESPHASIAVGGFVSFVIILFWSKLDLRFVHAYVIPVGLGILALLQLLREKLSPGTRNTVRLITLLAMIGSSGYYALLDESHPLAFLLTLGVLCLAAMALGGFLRIRLYLVLGFSGLVVDLGAVLYRVLVTMDRGPRMTAVGSLVLLVGIALVFCAIYYKTHREAIQAKIDGWRERLRSWE